MNYRTKNTKKTLRDLRWQICELAHQYDKIIDNAEKIAAGHTLTGEKYWRYRKLHSKMILKSNLYWELSGILLNEEEAR